MRHSEGLLLTTLPRLWVSSFMLFCNDSEENLEVNLFVIIEAVFVLVESERMVLKCFRMIEASLSCLLLDFDLGVLVVELEFVVNDWIVVNILCDGALVSD